MKYNFPEFDMAICDKPQTLMEAAVLLAWMQSIPCVVSKFIFLTFDFGIEI